MSRAEEGVRSMHRVEDFILGNDALHERFRAIAKLLGIMVTITPRSASIAQLETYTGYAGSILIKLCEGLWQAGMLQPAAEEGVWMLCAEPGAITLEDVFHCAVGKPTRAKRGAWPDLRERAHDDVDLLIMQATIAVNQSMLQHLRRFPLHRLQIRAGGVPPYIDTEEQHMSLDEPG